MHARLFGAALATLLCAGCALRAAAPVSDPEPRLGASGPVILLFGPLGDTTGARMIPLAERVRHCGSVSMHPHSTWGSLIEPLREAARKGRSIRVAGYSMGGNAARELAAAIAPYRVARLVTIDPNAAVGRKPDNVVHALNIRQTTRPLGRGLLAGARDRVIEISHFAFLSDDRVLGLAASTICGR